MIYDKNKPAFSENFTLFWCPKKPLTCRGKTKTRKTLRAPATQLFFMVTSYNLSLNGHSSNLKNMFVTAKKVPKVEKTKTNKQKNISR